MHGRKHNLIIRAMRFVGRDERGTQLIELAIVVPLMLMLVAATAEFGRYFYTYSTLAKATRLGTRYLVSQPAGTKETEARNLVVYGNSAGTGKSVITGLTSANVRISSVKSSNGMTETITVAIENYKYTPLFNLGRLTGNSALAPNVNLTPSVTMRYLLMT